MKRLEKEIMEKKGKVWELANQGKAKRQEATQ